MTPPYEIQSKAKQSTSDKSDENQISGYIGCRGILGGGSDLGQRALFGEMEISYYLE